MSRLNINPLHYKLEQRVEFELITLQELINEHYISGRIDSTAKNEIMFQISDLVLTMKECYGKIG